MNTYHVVRFINLIHIPNRKTLMIAYTIHMNGYMKHRMSCRPFTLETYGQQMTTSIRPYNHTYASITCSQ